MSAALLIVAGLLTSSLTRLLNVDKGFSADRVLVVDLGLAGSRYLEPAVRERFFDRLLATTGALPGVEAAGVVTHLPTRGEGWNDPIYLEGAPPERKYTVNNRYTSPGYFRAMDIAVLSGRIFDERDRGRGVAVLSQKAVQLLWPGEPNVLGRLFMGEDDKPKTLVGIVADALRAALRREDAQLPIPAMQTMREVVDGSVAQRRLHRTLMLAFAASGLLVASLGIYGVVSYSVVRRRNEVGIRMALGASRSRLLGLVLRQGMAPVVLGSPPVFSSPSRSATPSAACCSGFSRPTRSRFLASASCCSPSEPWPASFPLDGPPARTPSPRSGSSRGYSDLRVALLSPRDAGGRCRRTGMGGVVSPDASAAVRGKRQSSLRSSRSGCAPCSWGGQACVLYGAAEFSRDTDLAVLASPANLERLQAALDDLDACGSTS